MKSSDVTRLSPLHQALIRAQTKVADSHKKPHQPKPTMFGEGFDSMLELDFACELDQWFRDGLITRWDYHPMRFRIAQSVNYTPDFFTEAPSFVRMTDFITREYAGLSIFEVKGSWNAKNARDARTKLEVAAYLYQWASWYAATRVDGIWKIETIHAHTALGEANEQEEKS